MDVCAESHRIAEVIAGSVPEMMSHRVKNVKCIEMGTKPEKV